MLASKDAVSDHNELAARMWGSGGRAYDDISFAISDALAHAAQRLNPQSGEKILDVGTGTGWSARNVARRGAHVEAVDISSELLAAARELSGTSSRPSRFSWRTWSACPSRTDISMA